MVHPLASPSDTIQALRNLGLRLEDVRVQPKKLLDSPENVSECIDTPIHLTS